MLWIPLIAAVTCLVSLWLLKRHAPRLGLMDEPGVRKVHKTPVPRIGGIAILLGWVAALAVWQWANPSSWAWLQELVASPVHAAEKGLEANPELSSSAQEALLPTGIGYTGLTLLVAVLAMGLLGLIDDRFNLRARHKLGAQLVVATALCASGLRLETIQFTQGAFLHLGDWSWPITILWLVGVTNAINLIDGLDGLAGGIAALTVAVLGYIGWESGNHDLFILSLTMIGSQAAFLRFNWHPARAYLGDAGSLSLGMFCAAGTLAALQGQPRYDNLLLPMIAMAVALGDMAISVLRRVLERRSPFAPDRGHIHHVLLGLGLRTPRVAAVLHSCTAVGLALALAGRQGNGILRMFAMVLGAGTVLGLFWGVGYFRIRATMRAWRDSTALNRESREDQRVFEEAELEMRESTDSRSAWQVVCGLVDTWGFRGIEVRPATSLLESCEQPGSRFSYPVAINTRTGDNTPIMNLRMEASVVFEGILHIVTVVMDARECELERCSRRFALLGRLIREAPQLRAKYQKVSSGDGANEPRASEAEECTRTAIA
jgi:UDP-GlcNAc:undecaprenyl-phosphate GlcNAc-1-phosphate transferase